MKFCSECGAKLAGESPKFCGECGHKLSEVGAPVDSRPNAELSDKELLEKANAGDAEAIKDVGLRHQKAGDNEAARQWYERAADLGHAGAMRNLGVLLYKVDDHDGALAWFVRCAESGSDLTMDRNSITDSRPVTVAARAASQAALEFVRMGRPDEAEEWIERSQDMGDDQALVFIAIYLKRAKDPRALDWCIRASDQGDVRGTGLVISMLGEQERYVEMAPYLARYMETDPEFKAIDQEKVALFARFVGLGFGVENDLVACGLWLERSLELGDAEAAKHLAALPAVSVDSSSADPSDVSDAKDSATDPSRLAELAASDNKLMRQFVAENPFTPVEVLSRLADDPESLVRGSVGGNPSTPIGVVLRLASDPEENVRERVAIERVALWAIETGVPLRIGGELCDHHHGETIVMAMAGAPDGTRDLVAAQRISDRSGVWRKIYAAAGIAWEIDDDTNGYGDRSQGGFLWIAPQAPDWWNEDFLRQRQIENGSTSGQRLPSYVWDDLKTSFDATTAAQVLQEIADRWLTSNAAGQLPEQWETWDYEERRDWDDVRRAIDGAVVRNPSTPDAVLRQVASGNFDDPTRSQVENEGLKWLVTRNPGASDETRALAASSLTVSSYESQVPVLNWKASVDSVFTHHLDQQLDGSEVRLLSEEGWSCADQLKDRLFDVDYSYVDDADMDMNVFDYEVEED